MILQVTEKTAQYACYIFEPVDSDGWSVVHEDGGMVVHRRELEEDGVVVDPLKAEYHARVCVSVGDCAFCVVCISMCVWIYLW